MKLTLSLLIALFAAALGLLAGRIEYLRRYEAFHHCEARRYAEMIGAQRNITQVEVDAALETAAEDPQDDRLDYKYRQVFHHQSAAHLYNEATYRPWTVVHEGPLPEQRYDD